MSTDYGPSGTDAAPSTSALRTGPDVPSDRSASARRGVDLSEAPTDVQVVLNRIIHLEDENERLAAKVARLQAGRDRPQAENERLRAAADEAITTLALLRGYVEPGEAWDSEPWLAINACIRSMMQATGESAALASDVREAE